MFYSRFISQNIWELWGLFHQTLVWRMWRVKIRSLHPHNIHTLGCPHVFDCFSLNFIDSLKFYHWWPSKLSLCLNHFLEHSQQPFQVYHGNLRFRSNSLAKNFPLICIEKSRHIDLYTYIYNCSVYWIYIFTYLNHYVHMYVYVRRCILHFKHNICWLCW